MFVFPLTSKVCILVVQVCISEMQVCIATTQMYMSVSIYIRALVAMVSLHAPNTDEATTCEIEMEELRRQVQQFIEHLVLYEL